MGCQIMLYLHLSKEFSTVSAYMAGVALEAKKVQFITIHLHFTAWASLVFNAKL